MLGIAKLMFGWWDGHPIMGILGVSFATCAVAGTVTFTILRGPKAIVVGFALLMVGIGAGGKYIEWVTPQDTSITAALIQNDVSVLSKWDPQQAREHLRFFVTQSQLLQESDLIVWPETALSYTDSRLEKLKLWELLKQHPSDFLLGVIEIQQHDDGLSYYNSAYAISDEIQKYRKHRLVPFGEFTPFRKLLSWVADWVIIPESNFLSYRTSQNPLQLAGQLAGVSICYEDAFPTEILKMVPAATLLINISEDAWFGETLAPSQRLQMSRMRAIETARPVLRVANQGISASIDHKGNIVDQLSQSEGRVLSTTVVPTSGATLFVKTGYWPVLLICFLLIAFTFLNARRHSKRT